MSLTHRHAPAHGQDAPGFTKATTVEHGSNTFYATRDSSKELSRAWQLGVVLLEKEMDEFFWRAVATEGLAMIAFLFSVVTVIASNQDDVTELASDRIMLIASSFGLSIFILVFFTAGISGGNLNPAVTICLVIGKRISLVRGFFYIVAQCAGAIIGTLFAKIVVGPENFSAASAGANTLAEGYSIGQAICGEIICTVMLCLAVLIGLSGELWDLLPKAKMHVLLPLVVGGVVLLCHLIMIPVDGTSINPARSFGPAVVGDIWGDHIAFWVGPIVGAIIAIFLWEGLLRPWQIVPASS